ncbi:uncharacterized protein DUF4157 [Bradymonas sediminis]|nr:uncharacterized protein DUF4157 [Bradymonas sediminis]
MSMLKRRLYSDERDHVLAALQASEIAPPELCQKAVDRCVLLRRTPMVGEIRGLGGGVAYAALKTRASAITLGSKVYIRREFFGDDGEIPLNLVAHEVAHVVQFSRDGMLKFLYKYLRDYMAGLLRGLGDSAAYRAIPYEVEARRVADALRMSPA